MKYTKIITVEAASDEQAKQLAEAGATLINSLVAAGTPAHKLIGFAAKVKANPTKYKMFL